MFKIKPGLSLTSITNGIIPADIEVLRNTCFESFEIFPDVFAHDHDYALHREFMQMLKSAGKQVAAYHMPFYALDDISNVNEDFRRRAIKRYRALLQEVEFFEAKILVIHPSSEPIDQSRRHEHIDNLRNSLRELEPDLNNRNLRVAIEILPRKCLGNSLADIEAILHGLSNTFGCCLDVNHLMNNYAELPDIVRKLGAKIYNLHISDYDGVDEKHWLPFSGVINWPAFLHALKQINYQGPFNYELKSHTELPAADWLAAIESNIQRMNMILKQDN